jgi:glycosyltransferase involved in cell wall biosynthesis
LFGKTAEFEVVVDAIDEQRFGFDTKKRALVRQQLGISPEATVLGQVGRLVTQKNPLFALTVFGAAGRVMEVDGGKLDSLIYVGKGNLEHKLREQVANRIGKTQEVLVVSPVDNVQDYYAAFDALLLPSLYEGLGMVAVEAGISGLPVLASDRVPAEANVAKNLTYLPLAQPWTWVMALEKLVPRNIVERVSASKRATKAVIAAGYDVESAVKKLEELYEDLAH